MKPLLALIDFQHDYLSREEIEPAVSLVVSQAGRILRYCREQRVPIVHIRTEVTRWPDNRLLHWKRAERWPCEAGSPGYACPAELTELPSETVVHKSGYSGFGQTELLKHLHQHGVDTLILAGVYLHACVRQTALDAYQSGLNVWIAEDAVASDDPLHAAITQRYLAARAIEFAPVERLVEWLASGCFVEAPRPVDHVSSVVVRASTQASTQAAAWRRASLEERCTRIEPLIERLAADAPQLAPLIAQETGKPIRFCRTEIARTSEMVRAILSRATAAEDVSSLRATVRYRPHGTVAVITPFNNPVYLPLGKIVPAVLYGNSVVWKPAPEVTQVSARVCDLLRDAGLPDGLLCVLPGGRQAGQELVNDPRIDAVSFTGSSAVGYSVQEACGRRRIPLQAELGGNNAAIVWQDADLTAAARHVAAGAFDAAGQRCTANRRVIVHASVREPFLALLIQESRKLPWGDPSEESTRIGPLATAARREFVEAMVDRAETRWGTPLRPLGRDSPSVGGADDAWFPPTIVCCDDSQHEIVQEETFGPVLVVQTAGHWAKAIALCNGVRQGLVAAIFTNCKDIAERFMDEARAGILKLNRSTADAEVDVPFGGWKASGVGPPEHGTFDLAFYTRPQSVYGSPAELGRT